jgi:hypothetical protein
MTHSLRTLPAMILMAYFQLEMEANARILPSMDYRECFTDKERYYLRLARLGPFRMVDAKSFCNVTERG